MRFEDVSAKLEGQEWGITVEQGRELYDFFLKVRPGAVLELGTGIGTSACYMAAALDAIGEGGKVLTIDCDGNLPPYVERTFARVDARLLEYVEVRTADETYNEELLKIIEAQSAGGVCTPCFDFCFIDGAHTWCAEGYAFFLAEKLLRPGGWMLFDDMTWTSDTEEALARPEWIREMPQVLKVFDLLVRQHPGFDSFADVRDWGWARKKPEDGVAAPGVQEVFREATLREEVFGLGRKIGERVMGRFRG